MVVNDLISILKAHYVTSGPKSHKEIYYVYCGESEELLIEKASKNYAWVSSHVDKQSIDLSIDKELSCIVVPYDLVIDDAVIEYAEDNALPILASSYGSYRICVKIHQAFKERT